MRATLRGRRHSRKSGFPYSLNATVPQSSTTQVVTRRRERKEPSRSSGEDRGRLSVRQPEAGCTFRHNCVRIQAAEAQS
jgi:hypothetical protein